MTSQSRFEAEACAFVDIFSDVEYDCEEQTGGDWYKLGLAASLGGRIVHGINTSPSCELLMKTSYDIADKYTHGMIRFDATCRAGEAVSEEWEFQNYKNPAFRGVTSHSEMALSFDEGCWEPSMRTRAREAAMLAAGLEANGLSTEDAKLIVEKILCDEIGDEAIESVMLPVSHLKRSMLTVAKQHNTVYGLGNVQKAIVWEDNTLENEKVRENAAVDWGRMTTTARYLGEVNSRLDPAFRNLAKLAGIPYLLVENAWATVTSSDWLLDVDQFLHIEKPPNVSNYAPSVAKAYLGHEDDLLRNAARTLAIADTETRSAAYEAVFKLVEGMRGFKEKNRAKGVVMNETQVLAGLSKHAFTPAAAKSLVATAETAHTAYCEVASVAINGDSTSYEAAKALVRGDVTGHGDADAERVIANLVTRQTIWDKAAGDLGVILSSAETARKRMSTLKRSVFSSSVAFSFQVVLPRVLKQSTVIFAHTVAKFAVVNRGRLIPKLRTIGNANKLKTRHDIAVATKLVASLINQSKPAWAQRYANWSEVLSGDPESLEKSVCYGCASKAFASITFGLMTLRTSRFLDKSAPTKNYLWTSAIAYARKRSLPKPKVNMATISNAKELAQALDNQYNPEIRWETVEDFVHTRLQMFADDVHLGLEPSFPDTAGEPVPPVEEEVPVEAAAEAMDEELLALLMGGGVTTEVSKDVVLGSYKDFNTADAHAVANGYKDFSEAYTKLKDKARYDEETDYTRNGLTAAAPAARAEEEESVLA